MFMHFKNDDGNVAVLINTHVVIKIHIALVTYFDSRKSSAFEQSQVFGQTDPAKLCRPRSDCSFQYDQGILSASFGPITSWKNHILKSI